MVNDKQEIVCELNQFLTDALGDNTSHMFWYMSSGWYEAIFFNKVLLWDNENYESNPTIKNIKFEFKKYIDEVSKIKIKA